MCGSTELRPTPRLSKQQTSMPSPSSPSAAAASPDSSSSAAGSSDPVSPLICGPHESCVPANPSRPQPHPPFLKSEPRKQKGKKKNAENFRSPAKAMGSSTAYGHTDDEEHLGGAAAEAAVEEADAVPLVAVLVPVHLAVRHCSSSQQFPTASLWIPARMEEYDYYYGYGRRAN